MPDHGQHQQYQHQRHPWEIDLSLLTLRKRIGGGSSGIVFEGIYGSDGVVEHVAIKRLTLGPDLEDEDEAAKSVVGEARLLWELRHPRVLLFHGMCTKRSSLSTQIYLVTELCVGSLEYYLQPVKVQQIRTRVLGKRQQLPTYSRSFFWQWMVEVAEGMQFLHDMKVIHRDLKPHNLFLSTTHTVKIGDLGLSRVVMDGTAAAGGASLTTNIGSPLYMAPELLTMEAGNAHAHMSGEAVDVYAFGIILNAMWRERDPFESGQFGSIINMVQQVAKGARPLIPRDGTCPMQLRFLMERCWDPEPQRRPSFAEIHSAIRNMKPGEEIVRISVGGKTGGTFEVDKRCAVTVTGESPLLAAQDLGSGPTVRKSTDTAGLDQAPAEPKGGVALGKEALCAGACVKTSKGPGITGGEQGSSSSSSSRNSRRKSNRY
jgi:serine/threonine protein kinase